MHVLVVDDSPVDRRLAGAHVENLGGRVSYAADGQEALALLQRTRPDVVLTDLQMPGIDGLELVREIRDEDGDLPVILMTAFGSEDLAVAALRSGAVNYVPKRRLRADLGEALRSALGARHAALLARMVLQSLERSGTRFVLGYEEGAADALVAHLSSQLGEFGFCGETRRTQVRMALTEALRNAIDHGNLELDSRLREGSDEDYRKLGAERADTAPYDRRRVFVETGVTPERAVYIIRDEGPGFDPSTLPDPRDPENLVRASGRGVMLMRMFMDEVRFNNTGNEVTLELRRETEAA